MYSGQDAVDNKALLATGGKVTMPVFAIGAENFLGNRMADENAVRRQQRHGRHRVQLRALDHGGESTGHDHVGYRFPRQVVAVSSIHRHPVFPYDAVRVAKRQRKWVWVLCQNCVTCPLKPWSKTITYWDTSTQIDVAEVVESAVRW